MLKSVAFWRGYRGVPLFWQEFLFFFEKMLFSSLGLKTKGENQWWSTKKIRSKERVQRLICFTRAVLIISNQQRGLVAITIRGSVLFYSSAIWRPDFHSVKTEFGYLYGVDSIELRTLFYLWKMCCDHHWHWKNTKSKSRRCQFCWYLTCILTIRLRDFIDYQELER